MVTMPIFLENWEMARDFEDEGEAGVGSGEGVRHKGQTSAVGGVHGDHPCCGRLGDAGGRHVCVAHVRPLPALAWLERGGTRARGEVLAAGQAVRPRGGGGAHLVRDARPPHACLHDQDPGRCLLPPRLNPLLFRLSSQLPSFPISPPPHRAVRCRQRRTDRLAVYRNTRQERQVMSQKLRSAHTWPAGFLFFFEKKSRTQRGRRRNRCHEVQAAMA